MTLIEIMIAMSVSLMLIVMVTASVTVFSKSEVSVSNSANAASATRLALLQFQSDIQSAVPVGTVSTTSVTAFDDALEVTTQPAGAVVTWQYTPGTQHLTRQVGSGTPVVELTNVTNGDPTTTGIPVFHYFNNCGDDLVVNALAAVAAGTSYAVATASISGNATVVQITLAVANLDSAPYGTTTSVNVMNKSPGAVPCA